MQKLTIFLEKQAVFSHIGWEEAERRRGVNLLVDVSVTLQYRQVNENIDATIDYVKLVNLVNQEAGREWKLLETLGESMLARLQHMGGSDLLEINIQIKKPELPVEGYRAASAGICLNWQKS